MVKFNLDKKTNKNCPVFLSLHHNGRRLKVYTGRKIDADKWDIKTCRANPRKYKTNPQGFNQFLKDVEDSVTSLVNANKPVTKTELKQIIDKIAGKQTADTFFGFAEDYLTRQQSKGELKPNSVRNCRTALNHLKEFRPTLTFEEVDLHFYDKFVAYLKSKGQSTNTIGTNIKKVKWFMSAALDRDLHKNLNFKKKSFRTPTEETDEVYLTPDEINQLKKATLNPRLRKVADALIINCHLGQRFADWEKLTPENISTIDDDKYWILVQGKGMQVKVNIPIPDAILPLLKKYKYTCPILSEKGKLMSVQKFNQYLKEAVKAAGIDQPETIRKNGKEIKVPKYKLVSSHTARRSFATNLYLEKVPIQDIMAITGHKLESTFRIYIRADQLTKAKGLADHYKKVRPQ